MYSDINDAQFLMMVFGGFIVGLIAGIIPLANGLSRNKVNLAVWSFITCVLLGIIGGIIPAAIAAIIFMYYIRKEPKSPDNQ